MTTNNHTLLAASIAVLSQNATIPEKAAVLILLTLSHLPADAMPHGHYYSFEKLKETWHGAMFELVFGLFGLTAIIWYLSNISFIWLSSCVFAASLFDFAVATGNKIAHAFNHWLHWWAKNGFPTRDMWAWEIGETIALVITTIYIIRIYG